MGWFARTTSRTQVESLETAIGPSTSVQGTVRSDGGVRIDGALEGTIDVAGNVVIGEHARVVADVTARNLTVGGALRGNVDLTGQMQILSTGKVLGDVAVASLMIDDGGMFQGSSRLRGMDNAALPAPLDIADPDHDSSIVFEPVTDERTVDAASRPSVSAEVVDAASATPSDRGPRAETSDSHTKADPTGARVEPDSTGARATAETTAPRTVRATIVDVDEPDLDLDLDGLGIEPVIPDVVIEDVDAKPEPKPRTSSRRGRRKPAK